MLLFSTAAPVFKTGSKGTHRNYRPISLTCIACRLLEKIVAKNIIEFSEDHKIIMDRQF